MSSLPLDFPLLTHVPFNEGCINVVCMSAVTSGVHEVLGLDCLR